MRIADDRFVAIDLVADFPGFEFRPEWFSFRAHRLGFFRGLVLNGLEFLRRAGGRKALRLEPAFTAFNHLDRLARQAAGCFRSEPVAYRFTGAVRDRLPAESAAVMSAGVAAVHPWQAGFHIPGRFFDTARDRMYRDEWVFHRCQGKPAGIPTSVSEGF